MPCWQVRETTVDISAGDVGLLAEALKAEGATNVVVQGESISFRDREGNIGRFTKGGGLRVAEDSQFTRDPNSLKRAYSREVVKKTAKQFGWKATWSADGQKAVAVKRRF